MKIQLQTVSINNLNQLKVSAGTNCPMGGDAGHGGRTLIKLEDEGSTNMLVSVDNTPLKQCNSIQLVFGGDSECETLIEALQYCVDALARQRVINDAVKIDVDIP